jgi:amino acid adenylation domain-containing protein
MVNSIPVNNSLSFNNGLNEIPNVDLFKKLANSIKKNQTRPAFCISENFYSYKDLAKSISSIRHHISLHIPNSEKNIGLIANDDLETYASIIALWFEGKAYVPLNPDIPAERNKFIIIESGVKTILGSSGLDFDLPHAVTNTKDLPPSEMDLSLLPTASHELAYILFTSGTTGVPKGVPVTRENIASFVIGFDLLINSIDENDRWLQMFDLTFDLSIMSYLIPLLNGSCVYTIPAGKIKYSYIYKLIDEQQITGALLVPSVVHYLRPFFSEIHSVDMKYCLFCGEALSQDLAEKWQQCIPNAEVLNLYGPTENTIFCTSYALHKKSSSPNKSYKGILSIGRCMKDTLAIIVDNNNCPVPAGEKGELCLGGAQLTPGYWNNKKRNSEAFFYSDYAGKQERFYKTGDLCMIDEDSDIMYIGRMDTQVKIQGFRVELLEVEFHAKKFLGGINIVATTFSNIAGNNEIALVVESVPINNTVLMDYMKKHLPAYMVPSRIEFRSEFPYNKNGKVDINLLKHSLQLK